MVLKNLNDVSIFIAPLCNDNITWIDLTRESGFINAYTSDKNRPFLEDKVFFIYDSSVNTVESLNRYRKFEKLSTLYNKRYITINKKHYIVYCFNNPNYIKEIRNLQSSGKTLNLKASLKIYNFWNNVPVPQLSERLFLKKYLGYPIKAELPEEDYYSYEECGDSK